MQLRTKTWVTALLLATCVSASAHAQAEGERKNLIGREIEDAVEQSRWKLGPFRLTPQIQIGAGYDSNSLSSPTSPVEDTVFRVAPGIRSVVPLGDRALIEVHEELNFVHYQDLEQLRDVFNVTRLGGAIGGKNVLFRVQDEFRKGKLRPTSELDVPVDQRSNRFDAEMRLALGWRQELSLLYERARYRIEDSSLIDGVPVSSLLDRDEDSYLLQLSRQLTGKTDAVFEGLYQVLDYEDDDAGRDATAYGGVAGLAFSPRGNLNGLALVGFKRIVPKVQSQASYNGPVGSVDVRSRMGNRFRLRGLFSRDAEPSVLDNNWFFIENRYGGFLDIFLATKMFVRPGAVMGRNNYPRPVRFTNARGQEVLEPVEDRFGIYSVSVNYHLTPTLILRAGTSYLQRDSNLPSFDKDRWLLNFGITTELWPRLQAVSIRAWARQR